MSGNYQTYAERLLSRLEWIFICGVVLIMLIFGVVSTVTKDDNSAVSTNNVVTETITTDTIDTSDVETKELTTKEDVTDTSSDSEMISFGYFSISGETYKSINGIYNIVTYILLLFLILISLFVFAIIVMCYVVPLIQHKLHPEPTKEEEPDMTFDSWKRMLSKNVSYIMVYASHIRDENIKASVNNTLDVLRKIYKFANADDLKNGSVSKLNSYYLKEYQNLLMSYCRLTTCHNTSVQEAIEKLESSIISTETILENMLGEIIADDILDVSSSAAVYENMAVANGLLNQGVKL